jgi:hypothetical protein
MGWREFLSALGSAAAVAPFGRVRTGALGQKIAPTARRPLHGR